MRLALMIGGALALAPYAHAHDVGRYGPPSDAQHLYDIATAPSAARIRDDIQTLADFGTRHTLSETKSGTRGIGAARRWIFAEFEAISEACGGCLDVMYISDTVSGERRIPEPTEVVNVIAIQRGTMDPNRFVMMSGDIDSRVTDPLDGVSDSPGANDNASGMAGTLEAARVLSKYEFPGSIIYAGLSGEEQGLFGGKIVAAHALKQGWDIEAVLNNDMISNISGVDGVIDNTTARVFSEGTRYVETPEEANDRRFRGGEVDSPSRNLARYVKAMGDQYVTNLDVMMIYRLDRFRRGGHHRPFNEAGFPGVRIMETHEHYDRQHQDLRVETHMRLKPRDGMTPSRDNLEMVSMTLGVVEHVEADIMADKSIVVRPTDGGESGNLEKMLSNEMSFDFGEGLKPLDVLFETHEYEVVFGDTMEGVDGPYAAKLTALNAVTLAGMAGAPPFPANVEIEGAVRPSAKLTWETPDNAGNLAGYRVHWRLTTEPEWTHSRYVGNVNEWTFDNLVIDNYFFGVSAVAEDGSATPVVFPGAAGRF